MDLTVFSHYTKAEIWYLLTRVLFIPSARGSHWLLQSVFDIITDDLIIRLVLLTHTCVNISSTHNFICAIFHISMHDLTLRVLIHRGRVTHTCVRNPSLDQIMACLLVGARPISEPMLEYCQLDPWEQASVKFQSNLYIFFILESATENILCEMVAILFRERWVNALWPNDHTWCHRY